MKKQFWQKGYIALISAIIISAVLLVIAVSVGFSGFLSRQNSLSFQNKEQARGLAEGCVDEALLILGQNFNNNPGGSFSIGSQSCTIVSAQKNFPASGQVTITTAATIQSAVTNIQVVVNSADLSLVSWQEVP